MTAFTAPDLASCLGLYRASHWTTCKAEVLQHQFGLLQVYFSSSSEGDQVSIAELTADLALRERCDYADTQCEVSVMVFPIFARMQKALLCHMHLIRGSVPSSLP